MAKEKVVKLHRFTHTALDGLFRYAEFLNFGEIHVKFDPSTGLKAMIAVHNLRRGPAIGGARLVHYKTTDEAIKDVLRLAYMMSLKAAMAHLPHGGAKAVLIAPKIIRDRKAYLQSFGDFVNTLGGRYITAVDSGTNREDMDIIAERTPYVTCTTQYGENADPSLNTALGVSKAIQAAVKFKLKRDDLNGIHIAIQGAGHVGYFLAKDLHALGARLTVCDINEVALQRLVTEFGVETCGPNEIYDIEADIFSPCALGSILNLHTIKRLKVSIVAGSANNQLGHHHQSIMMVEKGILYAPDFLINSGGLIFASAMYDHADFVKAKAQVSNIYHAMMDVFEKAAIKNCSPLEIAESIAIERMNV